MGSYTYAQLDSKESVASIQEKMKGFILKFYEGWGTDEVILRDNTIEWQPITDIHLKSNLRQELSENSNILYLYIFGSVALFVLLVACVNFINMNLSLAFRRIKETGVRKVLGAAKPQLVKQYFSESLLQTTIASVFAIVILQVSFPLYTQLTGKSGSSLQLLDFNGVVFIVLLVIFISVVSGLYPALNMSAFTPARALKEEKDPTSSSSKVKRLLMTFQYIVAVFMIASTLLVYRQMHYFRAKDLGFDKEKVLAVKLHGTLGQEFVKNPETCRRARRATGPGRTCATEIR
jgi:putative ABC transport system permease protein